MSYFKTGDTATLDLRNIQSFNINIHVLYVQLHSLVIPRLILKSG